VASGERRLSGGAGGQLLHSCQRAAPVVPAAAAKAAHRAGILRKMAPSRKQQGVLMQVQAVADWLENAIRYDDSDFLPLMLGNHAIGYVNAAWRPVFVKASPVEVPQGLVPVALLAEGLDYAACSARLQQAAEAWRDAGWLNGWRNERFIAYLPDGTPCFELERAAFRPLGLTSRAVHLNGLSRLPDGEVRMWIGRRSPFKDVAPNRLDNLMGGGVAAGESIADALLREGWEEAGMQPAQLQPLQQQALLLATRPVARGLHREWLFVYDIWLDPATPPQNQDGEVAEHMLMPLAEVEQHILNGQFLSDAALVAADCLARLGYWGEASAQVAASLAAVRATVGENVQGR